ncbi:amidohydrolase [Candidatus Caldarchaeum subterraneum]|uniref:Amidohydrolase n=1 Tax=Caldiarchaeum subterraneum TaxID=311458 RepID=E6N805_CALS0|nr:amidohydrolase [Candidatus Caldarchaeum subterraneum]BAJ51196.1 amidohydrolase [Candidatus Caldarchaeum subterraneum]
MFIVRGRFVVTVDEVNRVFRDGGVVVEGDRIVDVGFFEDLKKRYRCDMVVGDEWKIVLPGLVNCHYHSREQLSQTMFPDGLGETTWFNNFCLPYHAALTPEEEKTAFRLALYAMALNGVTTFADGGLLYPSTTLETLDEIPLRCLASTWCWDRADIIPKTAEEAFEELTHLHREFRGGFGGRLDVCATPISVTTCSQKLLRQVVEWARENNVKTFIHVSSFREEVEKALSTFGVTPVQYLFERGLLSRDVNILHSIHLSMDDVARIVSSGAGVVSCPYSSLKKGKGISVRGVFPEMLAEGVRVGLGGDGAPSAQHVDMLRTLSLFTGLCRDIRMNASLPLAKDAIRFVTSTAADLLGLGHRVGSLEKGKKADIVLLDMRFPDFIPVLDMLQSVVFSATGAAVDTVIVDGRVVVEGRRVIGVDAERLFRESEAAAEKIAERLGLQRPM